MHHGFGADEVETMQSRRWLARPEPSTWLTEHLKKSAKPSVQRGGGCVQRELSAELAGA